MTGDEGFQEKYFLAGGRTPIVGTSKVPVSPFDLTRVTTLTFDCYGTLIDWEAGVIEVLRPLLARYGFTQSDDELVTGFQEIEAPLCESPL